MFAPECVNVHVQAFRADSYVYVEADVLGIDDTRQHCYKHLISSHRLPACIIIFYDDDDASLDVIWLANVFLMGGDF